MSMERSLIYYFPSVRTMLCFLVYDAPRRNLFHRYAVRNTSALKVYGDDQLEKMPILSKTFLDEARRTANLLTFFTFKFLIFNFCFSDSFQSKKGDFEYYKNNE